MKCLKCNHNLPNDSKFCQYCGNVIESKPEIDTEDEELISAIENSSDTIKTLGEVFAKNTVNAMKANSIEQPYNESDDDFGLVPEKPIFTLATKLVAGQEEYLRSLRTPNGERIKWSRRGSTMADGINGIIDIYDTYLLSGAFYKTIYINMYGAKTSQNVPEGFVLIKSETKQTNIDNTFWTAKKIKSNKQKKDKLVTFANISSIVLSVIAIVAIVIAMVVQEPKRAYFAQTNPIILYSLLLALFSVLLIFAISSLVMRCLKLTTGLSFSLIVAAIATAVDSSVFMTGRYNTNGKYLYCNNYEVVNACNIVWVVSAILIFIIVVLVANSVWFKSVRYRENCYKRVEKMHTYLEKGIITEEEFERNRKDILKNIKM